MPSLSSPRRKFSFSAISSDVMATRRSRTGTLYNEPSQRSRSDRSGQGDLETNSLGLTKQLVRDLQQLHHSRLQQDQSLSATGDYTKNAIINNNNHHNNNFLMQFTLRRQSHVSLNRLFGGMGETPAAAAAGRAGHTDTTSGARKNTASSRPPTRTGHVDESASDTDRCQPASVRSGYSLIHMASEKRARKVRFYRNGDRFFKGMVYAVSTERFRTFESLLSSLTSSPVCDSKVMPNGVRHIFSADGTRHVDSLEQLEEGESYVCASTDVFRSLDYCKNEEPDWNQRLFPYHNTQNVQRTQSRSAHQLRDQSGSREELSTALASSHGNTGQNNSHYRGSGPGRDRFGSGRSPRQTKLSDMSPERRKAFDEYQRSFVTPCLITVIRSGKRPRKAVRLLLNKKTALSFEQVMADISDAVKLDCGGVKKLFTVSGRQVTCLADFFLGETVFIACDSKKIHVNDLDLDEDEIRQVNAYRPFTRKVRERITLRKSPSSATPSKHSDGNPSSASSARSERTVGGQPQPGQGQETKKSSTTPDVVLSDGTAVPLPLAVSNKYQVGAVIGTGNFAVVMECRDKRTKRKYALKVINKDNCKGKEKMIDNEVSILRCVKHPNIVRLVEDYASQHQIYYVMELVKGGDLFDAIASTSSKYTEQDASGMLYNLASALEYLHSIHIVHRDVKPENILIRQHEDGTKSLKLGDFGLATEVNGPQYVVCGTPTYVAPEVIAETGYGLKIDVWSAGVIAYILLCGFPPFSSPTENQDELFDLIMKGNFTFPSPHWDDIGASAKDVISGMLNIDPSQRLSATQVLEHKWVANDTRYENDLRKNVSIGLSTYFRRGPKTSRKHASLKVLTTTALDKSSRFFQGRGQPSHRNRGHDTD